MRDYLRALPVFAGELPAFDPSAAPSSPSELFAEWLVAAVEAGVREPHAMTLSTAGANARVLILKNVDQRGWQFAAHAASPKGRELSQDPRAALTFYWSPQGRQIRVRGPVHPSPPEESAADFLARSPGARAEASLGRQSRPLTDRATLDNAVREAQRGIEGYVEPHWTLYTLAPGQVEFWQADKDRKHTRLRYSRTPSGWTRGLLWP
ncbi:pyridoxine/pyridoxamine 5'-phosphate oxidase [Paractinoplanes atraurantiacus]|uniref:Pyridoxamine 5'-phosphate oxidase n=1 Tax=Paractinoplanes atraurantiacus TaxID=1036182 RepID=A0A285HQK5_9ACTN|nr:pyridoxal 5'-phosphate synthase [Actinoplanes atraurantiacus]SNY37076.1 pyridoxamine 5'-phosphate oxidase [Actinoplanes atraurantiacus]